MLPAWDSQWSLRQTCRQCHLPKHRSQPQTRGGGGSFRVRLCQALLAGSTAIMGHTARVGERPPDRCQVVRPICLITWGEVREPLHFQNQVRRPQVPSASAVATPGPGSRHPWEPLPATASSWAAGGRSGSGHSRKVLTRMKAGPAPRGTSPGPAVCPSGLFPAAEGFLTPSSTRCRPMHLPQHTGPGGTPG